jgi:hypothetical protein
MNVLSDELFEQIVTTLAAGAETDLPSIAPPRDEQRKARRATLERGTTVRLIPLTDSMAPGAVDVTLRDLAPGGAGFLYPVRVGLDEQFVLLLPSEDGEVAVLCGVAYWQPLGPDCFAIGAKFNRVLRQGSAQPTPFKPVDAPVRRAV